MTPVPQHKSTLKATVPELIEVSDNRAFGEVLWQNVGSEERTR